MAIVSIQDLENTLESTRATLLASTNGDGVVSRDDFERLIDETSNPLEQKFLELFYDFVLKLDYKPRKRVSRASIEQGIRFLQEQVFPHLELRMHFGVRSTEKITQIDEAAFPISRELFRITTSKKLLSPVEVNNRISELSRGQLFFEDYGSEEAKPIGPFFRKHPAREVTPTSFVEALGLEPYYPRNEVSFFDAAEHVLSRFIDTNVQYGLSNRARAVVELMKENLNEIKIIILGDARNPTLRPNFPVYVIGRGHNSNLAGFKSTVVWNQRQLNIIT